MQGEKALADLDDGEDAEGVGVEPLRLRDVVDGEAGVER
jgi:hypothetical protein